MEFPLNKVSNSAAVKRRKKLIKALTTALEQNCLSQKIVEDRRSLKLWIASNQRLFFTHYL